MGPRKALKLRPKTVCESKKQKTGGGSISGQDVPEETRAGREGQAAQVVGYRVPSSFGSIRVDQVNNFSFQRKVISTLYQLNVKRS